MLKRDEDEVNDEEQEEKVKDGTGEENVKDKEDDAMDDK